MGNICNPKSNNEDVVPVSEKKVKNMPPRSYAIQVKRPQLYENVQRALTNVSKSLTQKLGIHNSKVRDIQDLPFFYIKSRKAFYQGNFNQNRLPQGYGIAIFEDGSYYQGQFKDGQAYDDEAIIIFPNGAIYRGQIKDSRMNGRGKLEHYGVYSYIGQWQNGMPTGKGKQTHGNEVQYDGEFESGLKQGNGTYAWDHGQSKYIGNFRDGLMHDQQGKMETADGVKYKGSFVRGKREGEGHLETRNGVLKGNFVNDQINGRGQFIWNDGKKYQGNFRKSQFHGPGRIVYPHGSVVQGEWNKNHNQSVLRLA